MELRYADGSRRLIPHGGSVTVREAAKLLKTYELAIHRLAERRKIRILNGAEGFARVPVASLLRLAKVIG